MGHSEYYLRSRCPSHNCQLSDRDSPTNRYSSDEEHLSWSLYDYYERDLDGMLNWCFVKKTESFRTQGVKLPPVEYLFKTPKWQDDTLKELQQIKDKLNSVKEKLNDYELSEWHKHTRSMNPADKVMRRLRREMKVEFLTQAWCKFFEIVNKFNLVPKNNKDDEEFRSYHLCEAPGAFVASLNHYLKLNHPNLKWSWKANSLNPYYEGNHLSEMINDDRFMLQTIDNWDFGPDNTGDVTHREYPAYLNEQYENAGPHLVTADGSFDCQDKPEEQENSVAWLHFKETLAALSMLRKDGNFVIKMFTFFECDTVCLLYLLAASFTDVSVIKPATSKEGNSEVYVVCRKFRGRESIEPHFSALQQITLEQFQNFAMFPSCNFNKLVSSPKERLVTVGGVPKIFLRQLIQVAQHFANIQMSIIERNIRLFPDRYDRELRRHTGFLQDKFFDKYVERYKLRPLYPEDNIVNMQRSKREMERRTPLIIEARDYNRGSHADKLRRSALSPNHLLDKITEELGGRLVANLSRTLCLEKTVPISPDDFCISFCKPIEVVRSTQFCHGQLIRLRNELIKVYGVEKYNIAATEINQNTDQDPRLYLDFSKFYMQKSHSAAQRLAYDAIYNALYEIRDRETLTFYGFPLLTQFNVNVLVVLKQLFKTITFHSPCTLVLESFDMKKLHSWLPMLHETWVEYAEARSIISFLPVWCITGSDNPLYNFVVNVNNARIYYEINRIIDFKPRTS